MPPIDLHLLREIGENTVVICSILHTFLPPWDAEPLKPFPTFQKYYRVLIYVVGYFGLNARSTVYKSISVGNPDSPNANSKTLNGGNR